MMQNEMHIDVSTLEGLGIEDVIGLAPEGVTVLVIMRGDRVLCRITNPTTSDNYQAAVAFSFNRAIPEKQPTFPGDSSSVADSEKVFGFGRIAGS